MKQMMTIDAENESLYLYIVGKFLSVMKIKN